MRIEYINPFLVSLTNTFRTMLGCEVARRQVELVQAQGPRYEVSGVVGLSGQAVGTVVVSLSKEVALQAASAMLMTELHEIDGDVIDAVGEITNMVAGAAKAQIEELHLSISLPSVVTGTNHSVRFPSNIKPIRILFDCPWGPLALEVGLEPVEAAVGA